MRTIISLIFILVMLPAVNANIDGGQCLKTMVCFVDATCLNYKAAEDFLILDQYNIGQLKSCKRYVAIRPKSEKEWEVSMSDSEATEIRLKMFSVTVFKCTSSAASTEMTNDLKISRNPIPNGPGVECSFNASVVGDGKNDFKSVLTDMEFLKFSKGKDKWSVGLTNKNIQDKLKCPDVIRDKSCTDDELCEDPGVIETPTQYSCENYDLIYQFNQTDWHASNTLYCKGRKFYSDPGNVYVPDEDITVKCVQKKCRQCTPPRDPKGSAKFEEPSQYDQCVFLHCDTPRMIINGNIKYSDSALTCSDSKWTVNNAEIDIRSIECVEKYDCQKFVPLEDSPETNQYTKPSFTDDLSLSCEPNHQMAIVDESTDKDQFVSHISCDFETGLWSIKDVSNQDKTPPTNALKVKCFRPHVDAPITEAPMSSRTTIAAIDEPRQTTESTTAASSWDTKYFLTISLPIIVVETAIVVFEVYWMIKHFRKRPAEREQKEEDKKGKTRQQYGGKEKTEVTEEVVKHKNETQASAQLQQSSHAPAPAPQAPSTIPQLSPP